MKARHEIPLGIGVGMLAGGLLVAGLAQFPGPDTRVVTVPYGHEVGDLAPHDILVFTDITHEECDQVGGRYDGEECFDVDF